MNVWTAVTCLTRQHFWRRLASQLTRLWDTAKKDVSCCRFSMRSALDVYACMFLYVIVKCVFVFSVNVQYIVSLCVCLNVWNICECVCSSLQAAPSTLGCRSTHSSPVHSASSRLSQGFSVSVPTLLFAGMKPRHRSSEAPRARQCRQVPHDPHDPVTTLPRTCHPVLHWQTAMTSPAPLPFSCQSNLVYSLKMPLTNQ